MRFQIAAELSWFRLDPTAEIRDFWAGNYPAMRDVEANLAAARKAGWMCVGHFSLPAKAWTDYYGPLKERLPDFRRACAGDPEAQGLADLTAREMSIMGRYADVCGYELFVLRRQETMTDRARRRLLMAGVGAAFVAPFSALGCCAPRRVVRRP